MYYCDFPSHFIVLIFGSAIRLSKSILLLIFTTFLIHPHFHNAQAHHYAFHCVSSKWECVCVWCFNCRWKVDSMNLFVHYLNKLVLFTALSLSLNPHSLPFPRSLARFLVCWLNSSKCTLFSRSYTTHSQIKANWIHGKTLSLFYCFNIYPLDTFLCCFLWAPKLHDNDSTIINPLPLSISFSPEMGWCGCSCSQ